MSEPSSLIEYALKKLSSDLKTQHLKYLELGQHIFPGYGILRNALIDHDDVFTEFWTRLNRFDLNMLPDSTVEYRCNSQVKSLDTLKYDDPEYSEWYLRLRSYPMSERRIFKPQDIESKKLEAVIDDYVNKQSDVVWPFLAHILKLRQTITFSQRFEYEQEDDFHRLIVVDPSIKGHYVVEFRLRGDIESEFLNQFIARNSTD